MNEILVENEPGKEKEDDLTLMQELNTTLRAMQERATMLIGRIADEIVLGIFEIDKHTYIHTYRLFILNYFSCFQRVSYKLMMN